MMMIDGEGPLSTSRIKQMYQYNASGRDNSVNRHAGQLDLSVM